MGPGYFVIAVLGCADGGTACTPVATLQTRYATEAQCAAARGEALIESDFDFPTLVATCQQQRERSADSHKTGREKPSRG